MDITGKSLCEAHLKLFGIDKNEHIGDEKYIRTYQVLSIVIRFSYFLILLALVYQLCYSEKYEGVGLIIGIIALICILVGNILLMQLKYYRK